jgi:hypothetical protein
VMAAEKSSRSLSSHLRAPQKQQVVRAGVHALPAWPGSLFTKSIGGAP